MATDSSILAWRIPWTQEPGRLQSTGSQRLSDRAHILILRLSATDVSDWVAHFTSHILEGRMGPIFFRAPIPPPTGQAAHKLESKETAGAFWRRAPVHPLLSTEQLGEACVHACECQGCRWHQTLEAAGTEANSARARTEARTGGGLYAQPTQDTTARRLRPRGLVSQQPVQSHPRHRVGPGERPPSAQLEPAAQPSPPGPLCRQAFSGPGAAPWDAQ